MVVGLIIGVAGIFPKYLSGGAAGTQSLASSGSQLAPHIFYLAAWGLSAALIMAGTNLTAFGAKLAFGVSLVSFGLFMGDIASGINASYIGPGLALSAAGWVLCTGGAVISYFAVGAGEKAGENKLHIGKLGVATVLALSLATAILYIPSWDTYTYTSVLSGAPVAHTYTAGDALQLPAPLIAGAVATAAVFLLSALYAMVIRKTKSAYLLFAGGILVMLGQVVSAYIQQDNPYSATGISRAAAQSHGIVVTDGFTPVFYGFFICLIILAVFLSSDLASSGYYSNRGNGIFVSFPATQNVSGTDASRQPVPPFDARWQNPTFRDQPQEGDASRFGPPPFDREG